MVEIKRRRAALSLMEVVVAMAMFSLASFAVYNFFIGGMRAFEQGESYSQGLEAASLAYELIACDIRQLAFYGAQDLDSGLADFLRIGDGGESLSLKRISDFQSIESGPRVSLESIEYRLVDGRLKRNEKVFPSIRLTSLSFEILNGRFLLVDIAGYGDGEERDTNLSCLLALDSVNERAKHPHWREVRERIFR